MRCALALFLLFQFELSAAPEASIVGRYRSPRAASGVIDQAIHLRIPVTNTLIASGATRLSHDFGELSTTEYKLGAEWLPFSFLSLSTRLHHTLFVDDKIGRTTLFFLLDGRIPISDTFSLWLSAGWYERYARLFSGTILPTLSGRGYRDHDLAFRIGLGINVMERWRVEAEASTFEVLDVYNLNSPFGELRVRHELKGSSIALVAMARYRVLLGFGRLAELVLGAAISWQFQGVKG